MSNKMLIDAAHPEETRVVVLRGNKVEEFDFEAAERQQLRGNIYLAKVTRVEPSLQAAFVDYGGNRHGFLAFSEIHPDYYQIPVADRQALIAEQAREDAEQAARDNRDDEDDAADASAEPDDGMSATAGEDATVDDIAGADPAEGAPEADPDDGTDLAEETGLTRRRRSARTATTDESETGENGADTMGSDETEGEDGEEEPIEEVGSTDAMEEVPVRRKPKPRQYKIQEVIKRRQVLLVQVVKEERGNKGAALTTYLSLAGRYSVLMPNTARGGGISRKITSLTDRKRLKAIANVLEVAEGMGVILRTAGASRTKAEIKRDFEYLLRLWENVRELTLKSTAPTLVYEEGSLIKRSIRDLYSKEIDQVLVAGDEGYREAKDFMRMLMPSHARNVQQYKENVPLFARHGVENQLDAMFSAQVTLKSGGYLVINQTEALVAIDVNSGRSTREHSIEDTALKTNLQAAEEAARQLRLRDLAGLIVIDFIDMEEKRNNRAVEKRLKECLKFDRARIQVGRISHFGLLEMSRQRIRTGVLESSTETCTTCHGSGHVRSVSSLTLQILRALDDHLMRHPGHDVTVRTRADVALYVLNQKRAHLSNLEERFGITLTISGEPPENGAGFQIEKGERSDRPAAVSTAIAMEDVAGPAEAAEGDPAEAAEPGEERKRRRKRRRRRGSASESEEASETQAIEAQDGDTGEDEGGTEPGNGRGDADTDAESERGGRKRRRGRRGGRRRGRGREQEAIAAETATPGNGDDRKDGAPTAKSTDTSAEMPSVADAATDESAAAESGSGETLNGEPQADLIADPAGASTARSRSGRRSRRSRNDEPATEIAATPDDLQPAAGGETQPEPAGPEAAISEDMAKPDRREPAIRAVGTSDDTAGEEPADASASGDGGTADDSADAAQDPPKRSGWWQRRSFL